MENSKEWTKWGDTPECQENSKCYYFALQAEFFKVSEICQVQAFGAQVDHQCVKGPQRMLTVLIIVPISWGLLNSLTFSDVFCD